MLITLNQIEEIFLQMTKTSNSPLMSRSGGAARTALSWTKILQTLAFAFVFAFTLLEGNHVSVKLKQNLFL